MYFLITIIITIAGAITFKTNDKDQFNKTISKGLFYTTNPSVILTTFIVYAIQSSAFNVLFSQFFKSRK
jgi:hypothetical protein